MKQNNVARSGAVFKLLLAELEAILKDDPTDRAAADFVLSLLNDGRIDFTMARDRYSTAVQRVYFES